MAKPGVYQVTLSSVGWVDVVQNGAALPVTGHTGMKDCAAIRKSVRFEIGSGPFSVQLSGIPQDIDQDRDPRGGVAFPSPRPLRGEGSSRSLAGREADALDVTMVGAAAASDDGDMRMALQQLAVLRTKLGRIAGIELGRVVELRVAAA